MHMPLETNPADRPLPQGDPDICLLSHGNWEETERAVRSALGFGLKVHLGVTVDDTPPFSDQNLTVYTVPWTNHFANARNNLLGQIVSKNRYVLWLDSDEFLFSFPTGQHKSLKDPIYGVQIVVQDGQTTSVRSSCHRRSDEVSFSGRIHERLHLSSAHAEARVSVLSGVVIFHSGYEDADHTHAKELRNLKIAETAIGEDSDDWGVVVSKARYYTSIGKATALDWIKVYKAAEKSATKFPNAGDRRWESAAALAHCGFLKPAEIVAASEPLNIPLHMSLLVGSFALSGAYCLDRIAFVARCLENRIWDDRYAFPLAWLQFSDAELADYVIEQAEELPWAKVSDHKKQKDEIMDQNTVFFRAGEILSETFEDDLVLLSRDTNRVLTLNETAQVFWDALEFGLSKAEACDLMKEAFENQPPSKIEAEIEALFAAFLEHGFIRNTSDRV